MKSVKLNLLACDLIDFLEEEGKKIPQGQQIIASTEVMESLFGVHKIVSGRGPNSMGRLILSMARRVGEKPSDPLIRAALEQINEKKVDMWLEEAFTKRA